MVAADVADFGSVLVFFGSRPARVVRHSEIAKEISLCPISPFGIPIA